MTESAELTIVFIGPSQKEALLEKMKTAAVKSEKHVNYQDTYYLTYVVDGSEVVVELIDPGLEHTGAREMSVRKAHGAILFYQASSQSSFNQLYDVAHDFENSKVKPIILIGNEDDIVQAEEECAEPSSAPEGYESDLHHPLTVETLPKSKSSVELTNQCHEDASITQLQGQRMADFFGPRCKFLSLTISSFDGTLKMMEEMIRTIRLQQQEQRRTLLERIKKIRSKKTLKMVKTTANSKSCSIS